MIFFYKIEKKVEAKIDINDGTKGRHNFLRNYKAESI